MSWNGPHAHQTFTLLIMFWGLLARKVCANGRQFKDLKSLTDAVAKAWDEIDEDYLKKLYQSLPKRLVEVIERPGACTHY